MDFATHAYSPMRYSDFKNPYIRIFLDTVFAMYEPFSEGRNAVKKEMIFSREILPNGTEVIYVREPETMELYFVKYLTPQEKQFGEKKGDAQGRGRTRGRQGVVKVTEKALQLDHRLLGFLCSLASLARYDNLQISKRKKPLNQEDIAKSLGMSKTYINCRFQELTEAGVLTKKDGGYFLDRDYVSKG